MACTPLITKAYEVEWLFMLNPSQTRLSQTRPGQPLPESSRTLPGQPNTPQPLTFPGASLPGSILLAPRTLPGALGRKIWTSWQLPRILKEHRPDLLLTAGQITGTEGAPDPACTPLSPDQKAGIQNRFSRGLEYFLADISGSRQDEAINLLKAFSLVKKRQRSNIRLLLLAPPAPHTLATPLATYKYKSEVQLIQALSLADGLGLLASAYAFIDIPGSDSPRLRIFDAWKSGTPVITGSLEHLPEHSGDSVLFAPPGDPAWLAERLMLLYKDETLRKDLIAKAAYNVQPLDWQRTADRVWQTIERMQTAHSH
jgi:glycosyltransferase involved in cell wall biosynthesis